MSSVNTWPGNGNASSEVIEPISEYIGHFTPGRKVRTDSGLCELWTAWDIAPIHPERYSSHVEGWYHERIMIMQCLGDGVCLTRGQQHLGDAYDRFVQIGFMISGTITTTQRETVSTITAGSVITLVLDEPFESKTGDGTDAILCFVPRGYFESRGINTDLMAGSVMHDVDLVPVVRNMVAWALELQREGDASQKRFIERSFMELFALVAERFSEGFTLMDDASLSMRRRVLDTIESDFADPGLSAQTVAKKLGLSRRQLYRLFEGRDASLAKLIRDRRLDHSEELMRHRGEMTIAGVASASGFQSADQFTRVFRQRHAASPSKFKSRFQS
ncbi:AraC family transcriptional regulator [Paeniglutamicibacter kerguelensis]|uniref:AraC-like DNA-binding protein n=1 Tax=Paeniglutamicibacter kerguelensis TaxID=254788 RepID=A0ABS4XFZ8_9MICC|nr:AraC family transcriptional regulator [Paeniglutamicibacter kerguelensis]MBP2387380.1 AraC-like DNA-binding protein [Paeniglutamicibacter kerguelensis]